MVSIGIISGLVAMLCWGVGDFLISIPTKKLGSMKTMFGFNLFSIILILPILAYSVLKGSLFISTENLILLIIGGIIDVAAIYKFFRSFEIGEISIVSPITASYSLVTVFLSLIFLGESPSLLKLISIFIVIAGLILTSGNIKNLKNLHTAKGVKDAFIAMILWGIYFTILGRVSETMDFVNLSIFTTVLVSFFFFVFAFFKGEYLKVEDLQKKHIGITLIISSLIYTAAWFVINYGITSDLVSLVVPISSLYPAITVILAVIFFKDKLIMNQKIGIVTILLGLFMISL